MFIRLIKDSIFFISLFFSINLASQSYREINDFQTIFDNLGPSAGLSNPYITDIFQDKTGYMWFATKDGLNRYDGYHFEVYRNIFRDSSSLSANLVTSIAEDAYGNLWIGTHHGLNKLNRITNTFERYYKEPKTNSLKNNHVRALHGDKEGNLWIETVDGTLNKFNIQEESFSFYTHSAVYQAYYHYHDIYEDKEGTIWIGGRNIMLTRLDKKSNKMVPVKYNYNNPPNEKVNDVACIFEDSKKNFWVTALDGAYKFNKKTESFSRFIRGSVYSVNEDRSGRLWFGTSSGIRIFDPATNSLSTCRADVNNPTSLCSNFINTIFIDRSGCTWIGTQDGISKHCPYKYKFGHYQHIPGRENSISSNNISSFESRDPDILWIGTDGGGLNKLNFETNEITKFTHSNGSSIASNRISTLYFDKSGKLWIGLWSGIGFHKMDTEKETFIKYRYNYESTHSDWYNDFLEDSKGNFWVGLWGASGLVKFDREKGKFPKPDFLPKVVLNKHKVNSTAYSYEGVIWIGNTAGCFEQFDLKLQQFRFIYPGQKMNSHKEALLYEENYITRINIEPFDSINSIVTEKSGNAWFGTNKGLYFYSAENNAFEKIMNKQNLNILSLFLDKKKHIIWLGCIDGLYKFRINNNDHNEIIQISKTESVYEIKAFSENQLLLTCRNKIRIFNTENRNSQDIQIKKQNLRINAAEKLNEFELLMGTNDGLLAYNLTRKTFRTINQNTFNKVHCLFKDKDKHIWLGTNTGLYFLIGFNADIQIKKPDYWEHFPVNDKHTEILSISEDDLGRMFFGTTTGTIIFDKRNNRFHPLRINEVDFCNLPVHLVSCLLEDNYGDIWIGTSNTGLSKLNREENMLYQYFYSPEDSNSFWGDGVSCLFEDSKNNLWAGGYGLNLFNRHTNSFKHYTTSHGLPDDIIMGILEDKNGNLWISTKKGLSKFNPQKGSFKNYFESDGLQANEFSGACIKLASGELVFGGKKGFNVFHPDSLKTNKHIPAVVITKLKIFEKQHHTDFSQSDGMVLNYDENTITFEFAALDYTNPANNQYAYFLEGNDKEWIQTTAGKRSVRYTNLRPGRYTFRVIASNNDGYWNKSGASLDIIIRPPFWKTVWFYGLEVLTVIILLWVIIRRREKRIKQNQKTNEMKQQLLRSQMNPHFIFNSLGAIQSFIFDNNPIDAGTYLADFSELMRLILENSRHELITLEKEIKTLEYYLELQQLRFEKKFEYQITIDKSLDTANILIPPMLAQPFIENSIEHGFNKLTFKGFILVSFRKKGDYIEFKFEDNGIGIDTSIKTKTLEGQSRHKSLATKITHDRIDMINKKSKQQLKLEITDLKSIGDNSSGTRVRFKIPLYYKNIN